MSFGDQSRTERAPALLTHKTVFSLTPMTMAFLQPRVCGSKAFFNTPAHFLCFPLGQWELGSN